MMIMLMIKLNDDGNTRYGHLGKSLLLIIIIIMCALLTNKLRVVKKFIFIVNQCDESMKSPYYV